MSDLGSFVKRLRDIMRNDAGINGDAQRIEQIAWMLFLKVYDAQEENWEFDEEDYVSIIPEDCRWRNWAVDDGKGTALTGDKLLEFVNNTLFPTLKGLDVDADTPIKKAIVKSTFEDANQYMKDGVLLRQVINIIDSVDFGDYEGKKLGIYHGKYGYYLKHGDTNIAIPKEYKNDEQACLAMTKETAVSLIK